MENHLLSQQQVLSQEQQQSLRILQMPTQELLGEIELMLESNPLLEVEEPAQASDDPQARAQEHDDDRRDDRGEDDSEFDAAQAETPVDDKQDEPAADDADKDNASDATEIEPDANKGEKPNEAQKPAEPTKSDSKKDETPASKPSEPAKPAEPSKPAETPSETPAAQDTGALSLLTSVWSTYSEDDKFPAAGGDAEHSVDGAPGSFDVSNADNLTYQLTFPSADVSLIDGAASLVHMMNLNTFTCGAFHVSDASNVSTVAADIRSAVQGKQWMCGFPDKLVIFTYDQYVVSLYGDEELVNTFRDKFTATYSDSTIAYDEAIL